MYTVLIHCMCTLSIYTVYVQCIQYIHQHRTNITGTITCVFLSGKHSCCLLSLSITLPRPIPETLKPHSYCATSPRASISHKVFLPARVQYSRADKWGASTGIPQVQCSETRLPTDDGTPPRTVELHVCILPLFSSPTRAAGVIECVIPAIFQISTRAPTSLNAFATS